MCKQPEHVQFKQDAIERAIQLIKEAPPLVVSS